MKTHYRVQAMVVALAGVVLALAPTDGKADEGMWLFNNPPRKLLQDKYKFDASDQWLEHVQKSAVRFSSGGSGSFVSPDGLVMTNHHVGADDLQKLSTEKIDYYKNGFYAKTRDLELKCTALELNVLMSIEDVTARVTAAVKPGTKPEEAFAARREVIAAIEKESLDKTKLRSNVITLYQGGQYHLYRFKRYTDIRLVFAPEQQIAFFGGDPDNFEYPRYDLDVCFFRIYEDGKPIKSEHYYKWSENGAKDNELVFVPGHPGRTSRLATMDELFYLRDKGYPFRLQRLFRLEVMYNAYSGRSAENARRAKEDLFSVQNSRKAFIGMLAGLLDPNIMKNKKAAELKLKEAVAKDPKLRETLASWDKIAKAEKTRADIIRDMTVFEQGAGFNSELFAIARTLVRAGEEKAKPNGERLREYAESNLQSVELDLYDEKPIYDDLEILKLTDGLTFLVEQLGYEDPLVQKALNGKSAEARARELIHETKLKKVDDRKRLYEGGKDAINASKDPMIELAKLVDERARKVRKTFETEVDEVKRQAYNQIANARFALKTDTYPDATFTLRLAFGVVKGYKEDGKDVPFETTFAGLYDRAADHKYMPPFDLPERWLQRKEKLNLKTPFNFVCTADITGGNSGSPVINRNAEVVGLIFDGNMQSHVLDITYTEEQARAVSVCSQGIIEALRKVYDAEGLAAEIVGKK